MRLTHHNGLRLTSLTMLSIGVTVVAAVAVCVMFITGVYNRALLQDASTNSEQAVQQATVAVDNYLTDLKDKLSLICQEIANVESPEQLQEQITVAARLQSDIDAIMVYDTEGHLLACGSDSGLLKTGDHPDLSFDEERFAQAEEYAILSPHVQTLFQERYPWVVTVARKETVNLYAEPVYVAVDYRFSDIAKYIDNVGIGQHGYCYIIDAAGKLVYHPQQQVIFSGLKEENLDAFSQLENGVHPGDGILYALQDLTQHTWRIVGVSYTDEMIAARTQKVVWGVFLAFFCCAVIAVLIMQLFFRIVNKPVSRLVTAMQTFEKNAGSYRYVPEPERVTELKTLSDSFGHMVGMIQELMERVRAEEITLRKTELKALQAQINPHFLYNTLDSIQWMCEQGKNEDAARMVNALARLFRISISHGHELIPIRDELLHAESYLIIQSFRYKNQFSYFFQVEDSVADCLCNKITIQPLIENAIYHGIQQMVDPGNITVSVRLAPDGDILLAVSDDGVGMTPEQTRKILEKNRSDSGGIGVKNVDDRLKIYFGEKYGIRIQSELDVGTTVTVRIPQLRKEPGNEI